MTMTLQPTARPYYVQLYGEHQMIRAPGYILDIKYTRPARVLFWRACTPHSRMQYFTDARYYHLPTTISHLRGAARRTHRTQVITRVSARSLASFVQPCVAANIHPSTHVTQSTGGAALSSRPSVTAPDTTCMRVGSCVVAQQTWQRVSGVVVAIAMAACSGATVYATAGRGAKPVPRGSEKPTNQLGKGHALSALSSTPPSAGA